jgi:cation diffusion facilitator family transporter
VDSHPHGNPDHHAHPHDNEPDHDHDHAHTLAPPTGWSRVGHAASHFLGGHSHDAADQIDSALEADADGRRALWISLGILTLTAVAQAVVAVWTGSVALLGDTLHNVTDALTAVPLLVAFGLARRPATTRFTYGFGRAEDLAGLFVIAVVTVSAVAAGWQAIDRLANPRPVHHLAAVAAAGVVGFVGNEVVARYRITVGRRIGSAALVADGLHARVDGFTSLAVVLGAAGVAAGWERADPIIGLLITVAILAVLRGAVMQVGARLMDAVDPEVVRQAVAAVSGVAGIHEVRELRLRWIGHSLRAEVDATVDPGLTVRQAHDIAHHAEDHLVAQVHRLSAATVHISPAGAHHLTT